MELDEHMMRFRLASRELFNHFFHVSTHDEERWVAYERFSFIEEQLFNALVTQPNDLARIHYGQLQTEIGVVLRRGEFAPWMLSREIGSGYWDHPLDEFNPDVRLQFLCFFDWDQVDFMDHRYVRVVVQSWPQYPEHVGKHALIESQYVRFVKW
jgi:hypothetical protein